MNGFTLAYDRFVAEEEALREALTSTGNGHYLHARCRRVGGRHGAHYPGTYAHGAYNRETTILGGRPVLNEDLVNLPNWLVLKLIIEGEESIDLENVELLSYRHALDIRTAVVVRELRFRDRAGRETTLRSRRFVSIAHVHQAGIEWTVTPENWSGGWKSSRRSTGGSRTTGLPGARGPPLGSGLAENFRWRGAPHTGRR
jgi:trehalose/maltose hydrolase-like predicted phosphorylase